MRASTEKGGDRTWQGRRLWNWRLQPVAYRDGTGWDIADTEERRPWDWHLVPNMRAWRRKRGGAHGTSASCVPSGAMHSSAFRGSMLRQNFSSPSVHACHLVLDFSLIERIKLSLRLKAYIENMGCFCSRGTKNEDDNKIKDKSSGGLQGPHRSRFEGGGGAKDGDMVILTGAVAAAQTTTWDGTADDTTGHHHHHHGTHDTTAHHHHVTHDTGHHHHHVTHDTTAHHGGGGGCGGGGGGGFSSGGGF
ncbi:hypothetical protein E2542_SST08832 [Spatholobus suberectus]|nr:hypothetical protein E2542_SST08832 [Spatholobus suberectus]